MKPISCRYIYLASFEFGHAIADVVDDWPVLTEALPGQSMQDLWISGAGADCCASTSVFPSLCLHEFFVLKFYSFTIVTICSLHLTVSYIETCLCLSVQLMSLCFYFCKQCHAQSGVGRVWVAESLT